MSTRRTDDEARETLFDLLHLGRPVYTVDEIVQKSGLDPELGRRMWRAMGFAEPPPDEVAFFESDLETMTAVKTLKDQGIADDELLVAMTRVFGQSLARVADAQVAAARERIARDADDVSPRDAALVIAPEAIPALEQSLVHVWRRHLAAAVERAGMFDDASDEVELTVGFADLVGYTRLSRQLDDPELRDLVERLANRSQDLISGLGGRVIKTIGDGVMFVVDDPRRAAEMALQLVDAVAEDDELPEMRVGLAFGGVVSHRGDYYGQTVNLASRAVGVARPGAILVADELKNELEDDDRFTLKAITRRRLKGIGLVRLWVLRRAGD